MAAHDRKDLTGVSSSWILTATMNFSHYLFIYFFPFIKHACNILFSMYDVYSLLLLFNLYIDDHGSSVASLLATARVLARGAKDCRLSHQNLVLYYTIYTNH